MKFSALQKIGENNVNTLAALKAELNGHYKYVNPWRRDPVKDPEFFTTQTKPVTYRGLEIYFHGGTMGADIVCKGVCLTQRASKSLQGAKLACDLVLAGYDWYTPNPFNGGHMTEEKSQTFLKQVDREKSEGLIFDGENRLKYIRCVLECGHTQIRQYKGIVPFQMDCTQCLDEAIERAKNGKS